MWFAFPISLHIRAARYQFESLVCGDKLFHYGTMKVPSSHNIRMNTLEQHPNSISDFAAIAGHNMQDAYSSK